MISDFEVFQAASATADAMIAAHGKAALTRCAASGDVVRYAYTLLALGILQFISDRVPDGVREIRAAISLLRVLGTEHRPALIMAESLLRSVVMSDEPQAKKGTWIYNFIRGCYQWYQRGKVYDSPRSVPDDKQRPCYDPGKKIGKGTS